MSDRLLPGGGRDIGEGGLKFFSSKEITRGGFLPGITPVMFVEGVALFTCRERGVKLFHTHCERGVMFLQNLIRIEISQGPPGNK